MADLFGAGAIPGRLTAGRPKTPDRPGDLFVNVYSNEQMGPGFDPLLSPSRNDANERAQMAGMMGGIRCGLVRVRLKGSARG